MEALLTQLLTAQTELEPQFKAYRMTMSALKTAVRLANEEKADALPMQKALLKLETAAADVESEALDTAVSAFAAATQTALDNLAFDFAKDLRDEFAKRDIIITLANRLEMGRYHRILPTDIAQRAVLQQLNLDKFRQVYGAVELVGDGRIHQQLHQLLSS